MVDRSRSPSAQSCPVIAGIADFAVRVKLVGPGRIRTPDLLTKCQVLYRSRLLGIRTQGSLRQTSGANTAMRQYS